MSISTHLSILTLLLAAFAQMTTEPIGSNNSPQIDHTPPDPPKAPAAAPSPGDCKNGHSEPVARFNFAARSSGAAIVGTSKDAKEAGAILSGDEDKYLMMPTSGAMWFAVKLSENIMVEQIELKNLEHYSSAIRRFAVFGSDKWPAERWTAQGEFEARDGAKSELFVFEKSFWAGFIKLEIADYYRSEFYVTLTQLRVFGSTMIEQLREEIQTGANAKNGAKAEIAAEAMPPPVLRKGCSPGRIVCDHSFADLTPGADRMRLLNGLESVADKLCLEHLARNFCFERDALAQQSAETPTAREIKAGDARRTEADKQRDELLNKRALEKPSAVENKSRAKAEEPSVVASSSAKNEISTEVVGGNIFKTLLDKIKNIESSQNEMEQETLQTIKSLQARISALEDELSELSRALKYTEDTVASSKTEIGAITITQTKLKRAIEGVFIAILAIAALRVVREIIITAC